MQNIANLQYDARPPVFISTNLRDYRTNEFRFCLDFNRNGLFEPTGYRQNKERVSLPRRPTIYIGDPQWIGVLERPIGPTRKEPVCGTLCLHRAAGRKEPGSELHS